jgi:hypothetical protein
MANEARVQWTKNTAEKRFWARLKKTKRCWLWTGARHKDGYGQLKYKGRHMLAHQVAWELTQGDRNGRCVLHKCDVRMCARPSHLFLGTRRDNSDDMIAKKRDRHPSADKSATAKLTWLDIHGIRVLKGKHRQIDLARMFNICQSHVSRILRGAAWKTR